MSELVVAYDLGTGGCKASIWAPDGACLAQTVRDYPTMYPGQGRHEQRPEDWWAAIVDATRQLIMLHPAVDEIVGIALSGHSLGVVPIDRSGRTLVDSVPIWSDSRGEVRARAAFDGGGEDAWYSTTGCGFPPALYPAFKIGWFADELPDIDDRTRWWLGSKDWVVNRLTGEVATDASYASGSGLLSFEGDNYDGQLLAQFGVDGDRLPPIVPSTAQVGALSPASADALGLRAGIAVFGGGVDNSCMAAGSRNTRPGRRYISLGSSSWVTSTSQSPVVDVADRPYTFRSLVPGLFDSALSTFSSGTSVRWARELVIGSAATSSDSEFVDLAKSAPLGSDGLVALPMLAGGAPIEGGSHIRGGLIGLEVSHTSAHIARAFVEGAAFAVARAFSRLESDADDEPVLLTGGGSASPWTCSLYADLLGRTVVTSSVGRQAAALGAAASAFVGAGVWPSIAEADTAHGDLTRYDPDSAAHDQYLEAAARFEAVLDGHITTSTLIAERDSNRRERSNGPS